MKNFGMLKLKTQIFIGCLSPVVFLLFLSGVTYLNFRNVLQEQVNLEATNNNILNLSRTVASLSMMVQAVKEQVLFPETTGYQESFEKDAQTFTQVSASLKNNLHDPQQQEKINAILTEGDTIVTAGQKTFDLLKANQVEPAKAIAKTITLTKTNEVYPALLAEATKTLEQSKQAERSVGHILILTIALGTLVCAVFTAVASSLITNWIGRKLTQAGSEITGSFSEIVATVEQQERIANQQAVSVNQTTATMDELEASCRQSSEQAQSAVAAAQQALQSAQSGTQTVGETLTGIFTMQAKVEAIAEQIVRLSEQAGQIGTISQLVYDLANQTSMLAINSSMEAARAGEYGKGFAVIANEIRKLSNQSQQSAEKIGALVTEIQKAINSTVMVTDEGTKTVKIGVEIAQKTEQAFTEVINAVNKVVMNNQQVSLNLKQQVDAIQQVVEAMESINEGAREAAAGLTQTKTGTHQLNKAALLLQEIL